MSVLLLEIENDYLFNMNLAAAQEQKGIANKQTDKKRTNKQTNFVLLVCTVLTLGFSGAIFSLSSQRAANL